MAPGAAPAAKAGRPRSDAKRQAILRGATAAFMEHGFGGTRMDIVAALAGVSKMTVYRYFKNKEALFAGVIIDTCDRIVDDDLAALMVDRPIEEALRAFGRRMLSIIFSPEAIALHRIVIAECRRFPQLGTLFYESGPQGSIAVLADYLRRHAGNPRLRIKDPWRAAEEFLELLRGYSHLRLLLGIQSRHSERELAERVERAVSHLLADGGPR
ncbi:MAG TPA: TetR/AcrR family transcriptional regulator C-terminal domain-containing protein [Alphaproteobacteria bacterium]|jgi:TetR/AcrR family transcriptional repressor of mexJK operon